MPNVFAYAMLAIWPLAIWQMYVRLPPGRALIWSVLGAYLLLPPYPAQFDFPLLPPFDKVTLPNISLLAIVLLMYASAFRILPQSKPAKWLVIVFIVSPILTVATNTEPLIFIEASIRGLILRDALAIPITQFLSLIGFLLARNFLTREQDQRDLLLAFLIGGMAYSLPMLLEVRLSPQLNNWIYGYFQHLFSQSVRGGGFRPMVFLYHGIWVAFFALTALVAGLALWRTESFPKRVKYLVMVGYLGIVLVLCRTLASLVYGAFLGVVILFVGRRTQIRLAALIAIVALSYPLLKGVDLVPTQSLLTQAEKVSSERAASLRFRFDNEDILLDRANEKPVFGWGIWGRNHLHDPVSGVIRSVTDGRWVLVLGLFGWVGFLAEFGLISLPIFLLGYEVRRMRSPPGSAGVRERETPPVSLSPYLGPLTLLLAVNLFDMIPNATITPLTWLISGALLGYAERMARTRVDAGQAVEDTRRLKTIL